MGAMSKIYPGETATPKQIIAMADAYKAAAAVLKHSKNGAKPLRNAPYRLLAIHAIELYLNAYLQARGMSALDIRRLQHNLARRTELALTERLVLRVRTAEHLRSLAETREYLITRYDPDGPNVSQINRLEATLNEVAKKVRFSL